jgi:ABC-type branched-subunit amino acid transport system ATPase component
MSVLETVQVSIRFGGVQANRDVSVAVSEWEIVGIIGPNGAGKTTLFNLITGFYAPDSGRVLHHGRAITHLPVHERAARGIARTFQNVGLVKGATVRDNLMTAQHLQARYGTVAGMLGSRRSRAAERDLRRRADGLADALGLGDLLDTQVAGLPYGTLKRVEIATVLATDPEVLLLDEPLRSLDVAERARLLRIPGRRRTVIFASRYPASEDGLVNQVALLREGRIAIHARRDELNEHELPLTLRGISTLADLTAVLVPAVVSA